MKRTPLKPDPEKVRRWQQRSREKAAENARAKPRKPLARSSGPKRKTSAKRRRPISQASPAQREKVRGAVSIVSGQGPCDPAHCWPRSMGGCDDPLCVVPLTREEHQALDQGDLDILPALIRGEEDPRAAARPGPRRRLAAPPARAGDQPAVGAAGAEGLMIYVAQPDVGGPVKIGYTRCQIPSEANRRLAALEPGCPWPLKLVVTLAAEFRLIESVAAEQASRN